MKRISELEKQYVLEVLESEFRSSKFVNMTQKFETEFAKFFDSKYAISFINGTSTMHAALEALEIGVGDEVIVPPLTMSATTFAVLHANATPVFADVDLDTFQISIDSVKNRITENTKAVIPVGLYGGCADLSELVNLCSAKGIHIIEDNAEVMGSTLNGKKVGTFGITSSFSLQSSKHLTSGEGGVLITDNVDFAEKVRRVQSLGYAGVGATKSKISKAEIQSPDYSRHISMGWNYRMPELCAAVGLAQIQRVGELVSIRTDTGELYSKAATGFEEILKPQKMVFNSTNTYWTWAAQLNLDNVDWNTFRQVFRGNGGDDFYGAWKLTYLEPFFQDKNLLGREKFIKPEYFSKYKEGLCPNAEFLQPRLVQFKTNYWEIDKAKLQAEALNRTLNDLM
jgi:perosamine synthetase